MLSLISSHFYAQAGLNLKIAVVQTAYANGSSTDYLENTMNVRESTQ